MTGSTKLGINVFKSINKGVDALHIKNHVGEKCKTYYPGVIESLRKTFTNSNTETAEQTFAWLSKFKKIMNPMNKKHHHFFLHCLVKERNRYTEWCYKNNISLKLPSINLDGPTLAPVD